jgi:hypothetical protein
MKKYQPLTELRSCLFSAETCGLYSIETSFLGYDTITKERLTDDEASIRAITGIMSFATLLMGWGQAGGVAEGVVIYMSMAAADSAQIATAYGCEQLGAPPVGNCIKLSQKREEYQRQISNITMQLHFQEITFRFHSLFQKITLRFYSLFREINLRFHSLTLDYAEKKRYF